MTKMGRRKRRQRNQRVTFLISQSGKRKRIRRLMTKGQPPSFRLSERALNDARFWRL
jgi:hypothetical protein